MKTKIKLMALVAGLLSILPTTSAWASTTYYAALKAAVSNGSTGAGKVYAGTSNKAETYASSSTSGNQSSTTQNDVKTFYAFAQAEKGFEFTGWSDSDGGAVNNTENPRTVTVKCSSSSESSPTTTTVWANFKKKLLDAFGIAFETSDAGTYTVDGGNPVDKTGLTEVTSVNLASADPNFLNWTVNGAAISDNPYTATCLADTTIGAVFLTPDQVAEATTYDELTAALANDGKKKITIPAGASCVIPAGTTFTVSTGKKLVVDGTLMVIGSIVNNGTIAGSGVIAYNAKTITQAAKVNVPYPAGTDGPVGTASGLVACDKDHKAEEVSSAGKYLNTSVADGVKALSDLSVKTKYFATVVNKASGETFMSSLLDSVPVAVVCTVARDKALNWISGMSGDTSAYADVKTALGKAQTGTVGGVANFNDDCNRLAVLLMNGSADYSSTANSSSDFSTIVDLANCSLTVTSSSKNKQFNRHAIVRAFNGSISLSQKVMSTKFFLYNCTGSLGYLSGGNQYGTAAYLYDSPNYSVTFKDLVTDSPAGSLNFCGGGPYTTTKVKFQTTPTTKFNVVYAGTFVSSMDPRKYLWDDNKVEAVQDPSTKNWIVQDKYVDPNKGQTLVNGEEHSFVEAFEIAKAGDVIKLQRDVELEEDLNVASGKDVRLDLSGFALSGDFKIVNNGELEIIDCNNGVVPSQVNVQIVNNGTLLLSNAAYNGDIMLNKGLCYFLAGSFNGDVILAADAVANEVAQVRGGTFAKSVYKQGGGEGTLLSLCENGYTEGGKIVQKPNSYIVGPGMAKKASFSIRALLPNDEALVTRVSSYEENRNRYTKTEWINLMTVRASSSFFAAWNVDCGARVDRDVGAGDLKLGVLIVTEDIPAISVGDSASVLLPAMRDSGMASGAWGYQSILPGGENADKVEFTVQGNQVAEGTSVWMEMRLVRSLHVLTQPKDWSYSGPYVVTGSRRFVVGAEANKAMVWGEEGGATFYSTLDMAVAADATTGKTIKLCNDCDEKVTVSKVCTIDTNGFAFNGEITAGDCYAVTATDLGDGKTQYEVKLSKVTVGIPAVANTTLAVSASEGAVTDLGNGRYQVAPGATVTATYTPNEGYFGEKIVKTIASAAEGAAVTVSSEEAASVKAIVAKIGEMPYASLAEAVEAAAESGETIDVVKDGTDATLAWPAADGATDHIIVTGGRYSADPSAFLADGLEAKQVGEKFVVGVKIVSGNTETETIVTTEKQESKVEKLEETEKAEVFKEVSAEKVAEVVEKIEQNTKVEGVKLTVAETEQKPAGIVAVVEEATKQAAAESKNEFVAAVEAAAEVSVKVEVEVKPTEYVAPSEQAQSNTGKVAFKLTPKATVTVVKEAETLTQTVPVSNDMIDRNQKIAVSIYTGFRPSTILHNDDDGALIESFSGEQIVYDAENGVATVQISHFSTLLASQEEIDVERELLPADVRETAVKVADGFYQNGATYTASTDFYITSKAGLEYFRDLVNQSGTAAEDYVNGGYFSSTVDQLYTNNIFSGKWVHLLVDVDLDNELWEPIGCSSSNPHGDKRYFYGDFDGHNHTISNLKVSLASTTGTSGYAGLFGYVQGANSYFKNLIIQNAEVVGYGNLGALVAVIHYQPWVENIHVRGIVKLETKCTGTADIGGIVGKYVGIGMMTNCSVIATANSGSYIKHTTNVSGSCGGVLGVMSGDGDPDCYILDCHTANITLSARHRVGGIVGMVQNTTAHAPDEYVTDCSVENIEVDVYGGGTELTKLGDRHSAQAGLIVGASTDKTRRYLHHYSNNTYSGDCKVVDKSAKPAKDVIPTQIYGLWTLGYTRNDDYRAFYGSDYTYGDTWVDPNGDADIVPEVVFDGTGYKTFLKAYLAATATGSGKAKPFVLNTDVGFTLRSGDKIYVQAGDHVFYPRTDAEYDIISEDVGDGVTLYRLGEPVSEVFASDGTLVKKCATLAEAFETAAEQTGTAENPVVIQLMAGTIEEDEITLPDTIKNITLKGAADHASILKNTTLAHRTNGKSFDGLTIDGVVFDNGRFLVVEWGNGSIKNLTFTNNIFRDLDDGTSEAAVHLNVNAAGAVSGFTFENNVIDGCTGGQKSGIYGAVKGNTTIRNNTINNVAFRPICVQIIDTDGEDDNTVVTGNTFSGSSVGRLQIYGTETETTCAPEGTDGGSFIVNNNIFKDITSQQICCWGINTEKVAADITGNYYDAKDPKMFWNDFNDANSFYISDTDIAANLPHANHDNFNYYTGLTEDGEIDPGTLVEVKKAAHVAKIGETEYATLAEAVAAVKAGWTVTLIADCAEAVTGGAVPFVLERGGKSFSGSIAAAEGFKTVASPIAGDNSIRYMPVGEEPVITAAMTKAASGFYQSGANFGASADFYITSKAGLEYFRDIINNFNGEAAAYRDSAAGAGFDLSAHRFSGKTINLLADVDLDNEVWTPIGRATDRDMLAGTFDGNNHVVNNLKTVYTTEGKDQAGFFGYSNKNFTIKNLTLQNVDITGFAYVGALISTGSNSGSQIVNCHVVGSVSITAVGSYVGGIVGHGYCSVSSCSVEATGGTGISVTGGGICVGGIYGYAASNPGDITDCSVSGLSISLAQNYVAGGIVGGVDRPLTVSGCSVEDVEIVCQRGPYLGYVVGNIQGGDGILAITDCTVASSTLLSHVDKYTEKEEAYLVQCGAYDAPTCYYVGSNVEVDENGKVIGGLYEWLPDGLVAAGYEKVVQGTTPETWVVQEKPAPVVPIAEIVGKEGAYTSLNDAILAAGADDVIRMLADADVGDVMGAYRSQKGYAYKLPGNLTIDLDNHEVKLGSVALFESGDDGKLLFTNGKININGAMGVVMEANDASSVFFAGKNGTLEFKSVDIVGTNVAASVIFRTYTKYAPLMRFDDCTISIDGCTDFAHTVQRVEFVDTQVQIKNNKGRVFWDNDGHTNDGGSKVTLLRSSVSVDGISKNGGEDVNAIVLDASSLSFKNYQTESMGANKCNIELKNGSSFALDGVGSHGFTNGKLVVNDGCTVDVKNVAYLGLNVTGDSIFKAGSKVSVSNCCATANTGKAAYYNQNIAMWSSGDSVVIENGADVKIDGRLIVKSGSLAIADGRYKSVEVESGTLTLTGGIYATQPVATYIAEGYVVVNNPDDATKAAYPWKVQEPTVTTEGAAPIVVDISKAGGEPSAEEVKVPVTVTEELAKEILGATTDVTKPLKAEQVTAIVTQLETKGEDGMTGWQKYAAGFSQTDKHPLAPKGKGTDDGKLVLVTSLITPKQLSVDTGVKVKYILKKATKVNPTTGVPDDGDFEAVQELPTPEFPVDVTTLDPETYWKIDVEYTATRVVETPVNPGN